MLLRGLVRHDVLDRAAAGGQQQGGHRGGGGEGDPEGAAGGGGTRVGAHGSSLTTDAVLKHHVRTRKWSGVTPTRRAGPAEEYSGVPRSPR
ncbi:hypothetical protein DEI98_00035 [Curtobacterium sp. MCLR17_034]|nr:hypothetical protein DEI98_00035 [Curtobacterium sp. MCLR17_034]